MGAPSRLRRRVVRTLAWLTAACAVLVLLGSCDYGTTRSWPDGSTMRDGTGRWAGWTFLCGLATLVV